MSFWAKLGVTISDLGCFKQSCKDWDIDYEEFQGQMNQSGMPVHAILKDRKGGSTAYLCKEGGGFRMVVDSDPNYSSITRRCGTKLTRDYAVNVVRKGVSRGGGIVNGVSEQADGSVVMRIAAVG
jgi:hypothetical protein